MKIIPLTRGQVAIVDDEDFEQFGHLNWYASWCKETRSFYARRTQPRDANGKRKVSILHREILRLDDPKIKGDHKNHDTLDCRRENLRVATHSQNTSHRKGVDAHNTSGFRGVCWNKKLRKWASKIQKDGIDIFLGYFVNKMDAADAYAAANLHYFGEFGGDLRR